MIKVISALLFSLLFATFFATAEQVENSVISGEHYLKIARQHEQKHDNRKAFDYARKGAALGHAESQYYLGVFYSIGAEEAGIVSNNELAFAWFTEAAIQGHSEAQFQIGLMYYYGDVSVQADNDKAVYWLKKSNSEKAKELLKQLNKQ